MFLPSYSSPDSLNPIQEAFSKIKGIVRKIGARTREVLVEAIQRALAAVTPEDMRQAGSLTVAMSRKTNLYEHHLKAARAGCK